MLVFILILAGNVLAMDGPITVQTEPGNHVKIYTWMPDGGPLLDLVEGDADEEGLFSTIFFALNEPTVKYQVRILSGLSPITEETFEGKGIENPLWIDCLSGECIMTIDTRVIVKEEPEETNSTEEIEEEINSTEENETNSTNETMEGLPQEITEEEITEDSSSFRITGNAILTKDDGSIRKSLIYGSILLFFLVMVFMIGMSHRKNPELKGMRYKEKELKKIEKEIKTKEKAIRNVKESNERKMKIEEAKNKLRDDEKELDSLEEDSSGLLQAKEKLYQKENELKELEEKKE